MFRSINSIYGFKLHATDGIVGKIENFFIDKDKWALRYLVVDTGSWLTGKLVLISPQSFAGKPEWGEKSFPVNLTRQMVKNSPDVDTEKPVSRQKEIDVLKYYKWPIYWEPYIGEAAIPRITPVALAEEIYEEETSHLHGTKYLSGYHIHASDGEIGHVDDFLIDDTDWVVRYIVVQTHNWIHGKKTLISPQWITKINWELSNLNIRFSRNKIKNSPEYNPETEITRDYENNLYDYYGKEKYWVK